MPETLPEQISTTQTIPAQTTDKQTASPQEAAAKEAAVLEVRGLCRSAGAHAILQDIDLTLHRGDVLTVLGPSGSGKTTLLRCLNYLERADAGEMTFLGRHFSMPAVSRRAATAFRQHTAFVFQNYNLFANKTALQNVTEGLLVARKLPKAEAETRGLRALERVGLIDKRDAYPTQLSGGQQQRVAIARAIAAEPEVIFFDEPTSALDPELIGEVLTVIRQLAQEGMTMIIVTHELRFARSVSTHALFLEAGRVLAAAPTEEFFQGQLPERIQNFFRTLEQAT